ncbi:hypothetical protein ACH5RR_008772 [Cinchona calisaya]|uniref:Uncharacterized protein n=1 Tax=Cinchona calisaya TaxID=153742 RepID=A0ABD3AFX2_9GENT
MGCLKLDLGVLWAGLLIHLTESTALNLELFEFGIRLEKSSPIDKGSLLGRLAALEVAELLPFPPPLPSSVLPQNGVLHAPIDFPAFDHRARYFLVDYWWELLR